MDTVKTIICLLTIVMAYAITGRIDYLSAQHYEQYQAANANADPPPTDYWGNPWVSAIANK